QPERPQLRQLLVGQRLPDAEGQRALLFQPLPQARRSEPAVLVMDRGDAAGRREPDAGSHGLDVLGLGNRQVALLEAPGRLLAQDARGLPVLAALDDAALDLEIATRERERGRVEPERVVVLREQRRGTVAGDRVEVGLRRLASLRPVAAAPAVPTQRAAG